MRVAHIVPAMVIGGVETGIAKSLRFLQHEIDYRVFYVKKPGLLEVGQRSILELLGDMARGSWRPDAVVTSLWWAHPFGWLLKRFGVRWVSFMHNGGFAHSLDRVVNVWAWRSADVRLVDSDSTRSAMSLFKPLYADRVPYVFPESVSPPAWTARPNDIAWVGRAVPQKRLDLFQDFLEALESAGCNLKVMVCAAGELPSAFRAYCIRSRHTVTIHLNCSNAEVQEQLRRSKCYALFSDYEGMSMSTIEAVQAGCLAIVRPVGEIPNYLAEDARLTLEAGTSDAIQRLAQQFGELMQSSAEERVEKMRLACQRSVSLLPSYRSELLAALRRAMNRAD